MPFRFAANRVIYWPVELPPRDLASTSGENKPQRVRVLYHLLKREELRERELRTVTTLATRLRTVIAKGGTAEEVGKIAEDFEREGMAEVDELVQRIKGWADGDVAVEGDAGASEVLPYSDANLRLILTDEAVFRAFRAGLYDASRGAVAKN